MGMRNLSKCHICNNYLFERQDEITCNLEEWYFLQMDCEPLNLRKL